MESDKIDFDSKQSARLFAAELLQRWERMFPGVKLNGWFRAYLVFGLVSFLLGFLGYLGTEPAAVSERFAQRWAELSARFPILADLNWLNQTAPAFNRFEMPTVLLLTPNQGGGPEFTGFNSEFEAKLKSFSPNIVRLPLNRSGGLPSLDNVTPYYRKYLLIGWQAGTLPSGNSQLTVGVPAYLASDLFTQLAAALPGNLGQFDWERKSIANGEIIIVQWRGELEEAKVKKIAAVCLNLFEKERTMAAKGFEL